MAFTAAAETSAAAAALDSPPPFIRNGDHRSAPLTGNTARCKRLAAAVSRWRRRGKGAHVLNDGVNGRPASGRVAYRNTASNDAGVGTNPQDNDNVLGT
jgi:hypothetical protein